LIANKLTLVRHTRSVLGKEVQGKSFERKPTFIREDTMFCKESALHYWSITTKLTSFLRHTSTVLRMDFQVSLSSGNLVTTEKVHCSPSEVPVLLHSCYSCLHLVNKNNNTEVYRYEYGAAKSYLVSLNHVTF